MNIPGKKFLYTLSFIEGASVMAAELLGAKMLAPYFGTSLYVWSTVLAITLGGLASGYLIGGFLSANKKSVNLLFYVLISAAAFTTIMPFLSRSVMVLFTRLSLMPALLFSSVLFLLPPVFLMGMVSPIIISLLTVESSESGKVAGIVYAISTVGGILSTFFIGFYVIPNYGLIIPCIFTGLILGALPFISLITKKKIFVIFFPFLLYAALKQPAVHPGDPTIKILYSSEGLLGQLLVTDCLDNSDKVKGEKWLRYLYVNHVAQSVISLTDTSVHGFPYVELIEKKIKLTAPRGKVLLLGLGGATLANTLINAGYTVDACEIDQRIANVARDFFYLSPKANVLIDDARHLIRTTTDKYDVVVFDLFKGEETPSHVFTSECMVESAKMLNKNGMLIVNGNGYWSGEEGKGMRSVYKTIANAGYKINVFSTPGLAGYRNLVFLASKEELNSQLTETRMAISEEEITDAYILEDNKPVLDLLNSKANMAWREGYNRYFRNTGVPLFN